MASLSGNVTFSAGLIASGTSQVTTLLSINTNSFYNDVEECVAINNGILLPVAPVLGTRYTIRNNGSLSTGLGVNLNVYPPLGANIEPLVTNFPLQVNVGSIASFIAINALTWHIESLSIPPALHIAQGVAAIQALYTQTGQHVYEFGALTQNVAVSIPTAVGNDGFKFIFACTAILGFTVTITPAAGLTIGSFLSVPATGGTVVGLAVAATKANCGFTAVAGLGTLLTMQSDGTNWICTGTAPIAASFA
jgi:hypothetical protein